MKVTFQKTIAEDVEVPFPMYFINQDSTEYFMFSGIDRYISVEIHFSVRSAYINCTTVLVESQLQHCLKHCRIVTQFEFIDGYAIAESMIRSHITSTCKMESK